jgi:hypothetical protein
VSKYSISNLEFLAVVWAVWLFRPHLYGRLFTIVTDHIALKWLITAKEPAGRLHRWTLTLQEYAFEIQYRPGKDNHVADALSQGPAPTDGGADAEEKEQEGDEPTIGSAEARPDAAAAGIAAAVQAVAAVDPDQGLGGSVAEDKIDSAARNVIQTTAVYRVEAAELGVVQFSDEDIRREQEKSVMVQTLRRNTHYRGRRVWCDGDGLVREATDVGDRIVLPTIYWALAFKEAHESIWADHLRDAVYSWLSVCQDCGSRKAKPKAVVPPLKSVKTGDVGDRCAIDVAGPLPVTAGGNRCVIAAVEYTTRYAVAAAVPEHTAKSIARFLMDKVVLVYGPMREVMMDGAREFGSKATAELLAFMQVNQATPVLYRPCNGVTLANTVCRTKDL